MSLLDEVITKLANDETLPLSNHDHNHSGDYLLYRECHITSDWLLIYKIESKKNILLLHRTGIHSDLFK